MLDAMQAQMRWSQLGGGPGVAASGLAWLAAGLVAERGASDLAAFGVLFAGGMLIVPLALLASRLFGRSGGPAPLGKLGFEATMTLFAGLFVGFCLLFVTPDLAIPLVAVVVGARYAVFASIYGNLAFYALGAAIAGLGAVAAIGLAVLPLHVAVLVGVVEIVAGLALTAAALRASRPDAQARPAG